MLEGLRNFAEPTPFATDRVAAEVALVPAQRARLTWGVVGALPPPSTFSVKPCSAKEKEVSRATVKRKIVDPNNPDNFVVFEDPVTLIMAKQDSDTINISFKTITVNFGLTFRGPLTTQISVSTNDTNQKQCQAEYDFLDEFAPSAGFEPLANFSPTGPGGF